MNMGRLTGGLLLALCAGLAHASYQPNIQPPVTRIASEVYDLRMLMMYAILMIFCVVFGVMLYSIYAHRKSVGNQAEQFHQSTAVEVVWTVIPFVIIMGMAWPATRTLIAFKNTAHPDITIKATGYQWKWGYDYLKGQGAGVAYLSALAAPQDPIKQSGGGALASPIGDQGRRPVLPRRVALPSGYPSLARTNRIPDRLWFFI